MNKKPGGQQNTEMKDGSFLGTPQRMVFGENDILLVDYTLKNGCKISISSDGPQPVPAELLGLGKGIYQVLAERKCMVDATKLQLQEHDHAGGLTLNVPQMLQQLDTVRACLEYQTGTCKSKSDATRGQCRCGLCVLSDCPDFAAQENGIQEVFTNYNLQHGTSHVCVFLPKFHPELNFSERCWAKMKSYLSTHTDFTLSGLRARVPIALGSENLPLATIRAALRQEVLGLLRSVRSRPRHDSCGRICPKKKCSLWTDKKCRRQDRTNDCRPNRRGYPL